MMKPQTAPKGALLLALLLALTLCAAMPALAERVITNDVADCFDYFPTSLTFDDDTLVLKGYFFNHNLDQTILDIRELEIIIYDSDRKEICTGIFDNLSDSLQGMRLTPGVSLQETFEFLDTARNPDNYNFSNGFSVEISCKFSSTDY